MCDDRVEFEAVDEKYESTLVQGGMYQRIEAQLVTLCMSPFE